MAASTQPPWRKTLNGINITFVKEEGNGHEVVPASVYIGANQARHWTIGQLYELRRYIHQAIGLLTLEEKNHGTTET